MSTIILTTNFSEGARNANLFAINLFGDKDVQYILLNSYSEPPSIHDVLPSINDLLEHNSLGNLKKERDILIEKFPNLKLNIEIKSSNGILAYNINELVNEFKANYVVLGNQKFFSVENKWLLKKTADLIRKIKCPILTIPSGLKFEKLKDVIYACDMKDLQDIDKLKPILDIASMHEAELKILNVTLKGENQIHPDDNSSGRELTRFFSKIPHKFYYSENENVIKGISDFIRSESNSLIVVLARKHNFLARILKKDTTKSITELAEVPQLILHDY